MIFNETFWPLAKKNIYICELTGKILRMVDYNPACMGFVYEGIDTKKEHTAAICNNCESQYQPLWDIDDGRWCMLHRPLLGAGVFLEPSYFHVPKDRDILERFYSL